MSPINQDFAPLLNHQYPNIEEDLISTLRPMGTRQKLWLAALAAVCLWGLIAFVHQCRIGLAATAMTNYFSWGVYIINFVFFIGISHAGTLVSAILRVTGAGWRRPITRMAEAITVFALMIGAPMIIIDMGRPDRVLNVIIHGRLQSPILWDVCSVTTYLTGSLMYLYLPMIPDMAILRDHPGFAPWRRWLYGKLSLGWTGTSDQWRRLERAISVMAVVIIPVAISVHTVVSWIFGMTLRAGWHSTIFGPYFVVGAIFSGIAALITAMAIFTWYYRDSNLGRYVTPDIFKKLASLLLAVNLIYIYFTVSEYLTMGYPSEGPDKRLIDSLFTGQYSIQFWGMAIFGLFIPALLLALPWTRTLKGILIASILINIGMWVKRYVIVVPTLSSPFMPVLTPSGKPISYVPTWVEWSITAGAFAGFAMLYLLFSKVFPIVSIWEMRGDDEVHEHVAARKDGVHRPLLARRGVVVPVVMFAVTVLAFTSKGSAQATAPATVTPATTQPAAQIALTVVVEDNQKLVRATVTAGGKPVENADVAFFVRRTFGDLALGKDRTLDDGTAAVNFPTGIPLDATGRLVLIGEIKSPAPVAGACSSIDADGGVPVVAEANPFPRALWSPHAPLPLLIVLCSLLGGVWITYLFVVSQIVAIGKGAGGMKSRTVKTLLILMFATAIVATRSWADNPPEEWKAPARATKRKNPIPSDDKSIAEGKVVFTAQCLSCHGPAGHGDGPAAKDLNPKPRNLSDPAIQSQTDGSIFWKITEGRKPMPTFGTLISETDRWNVINYVRTLAAKGAK